jgi:hypothetical protein
MWKSAIRKADILSITPGRHRLKFLAFTFISPSPMFPTEAALFCVVLIHGTISFNLYFHHLFKRPSRFSTERTMVTTILYRQFYTEFMTQIFLKMTNFLDINHHLFWSKTHDVLVTGVCLHHPEIGTSAIYWARQSRCPFFIWWRRQTPVSETLCY